MNEKLAFEIIEKMRLNIEASGAAHDKIREAVDFLKSKICKCSKECSKEGQPN